MGMLVKMASSGIPFSKVADIGDVLDFGSKAVVGTAVIAGVPLGILAHAIGKHITQSRNKERELRERIGYFDEATSALNRGLSAQ
jgi:hypothetical protein